MIRLYHVTKVHASGAEVLHDAYFSVEKGEWVVVTGEGRTGKSTLLKLLCGEEKPTWGLVTVEGRDINDMKPEERARWLTGVGLIFPDLGLLPGRTVEENLLLPTILRGESTDPLRARMRSLLGAAGLSGKGGYLTEELSQSEQRLTATLRAVLPQPRLLLADEPFQGLSPRSADFLLSLFQDLHHNGTTLVVASADWTAHVPPSEISFVKLADGKLRSTENAHRDYEAAL
jgi:cell division transport system ATP-binding protein